MKSLLNIDHSLSSDQTLYRIIDFFGAASIIENQQFMFTRSDLFNDKNEGIERMLGQLQITTPNSGFGMGWHDDESARILHQDAKRSHFISSWSNNPESVAMWSLYSPDYCSVRISSTVQKLQIPIENLLQKYSIERFNESDYGNRVVTAMNGRLAPVTYDSLSLIHKQVERRAKARARLAERYAKKGQDFPWMKRQSNRRKYFDELKITCSLKDIGFKHEEEIRLVVQLGEAKWSDSMVQVQDGLISSRDEAKYRNARSILEVFEYVRTTHIPEREFVECPIDLIETVAIDPRCPKHKAEFMKRWFSDKGISIVESTCFGYIPDNFEIYPYW